MNSIRQEKSNLVTRIRSLKAQRKPLKGYVPNLAHAQYEYRHLHIAHCLLRGRSYEQIEPKVRAGNEPNWGKIDGLKALYSRVETPVQESAGSTSVPQCSRMVG